MSSRTGCLQEKPIPIQPEYEDPAKCRQGQALKSTSENFTVGSGMLPEGLVQNELYDKEATLVSGETDDCDAIIKEVSDKKLHSSQSFYVIVVCSEENEWFAEVIADLDANEDDRRGYRCW